MKTIGTLLLVAFGMCSPINGAQLYLSRPDGFVSFDSDLYGTEQHYRSAYNFYHEVDVEYAIEGHYARGSAYGFVDVDQDAVFTIGTSLDVARYLPVDRYENANVNADMYFQFWVDEPMDLIFSGRHEGTGSSASISLQGIFQGAPGNPTTFFSLFRGIHDVGEIGWNTTLSLVPGWEYYLFAGTQTGLSDSPFTQNEGASHLSAYLFPVDFYSHTVAFVPEPSTLAISCICMMLLAGKMIVRKR